jgi:DNA-binding NtrC family response regulator
MLIGPQNDDLGRCLGTVVGDTPEIRKTHKIIQIAARGDHPVLIVGEPGTRKELVARAIHSSSNRAGHPFRVYDCRTVRAIDLERELSGGAKATPSDGGHGTVFLDQIVELELELQAILLRALQRSESGQTADEQKQPRIIAASTVHPREKVNRGSFRRDLYFRLDTLSLRIPPLRERRSDISLLAENFLNAFSHKSGHRYQLSDEAFRALLTYDWPGNVRELEECLARACEHSSGSGILPEDLPTEIGGGGGRIRETLRLGLIPLSEVERRTIEEVVRALDGDKQTAARLLGIGKSTLYRKLREYEAQREARNLGGWVRVDDTKFD